MESLPGSVTRAYQELADDPKYQHFVRIPGRIIECLDYFTIACDRDAVKASLLAYYLFIGVVDEAIDSGKIDSGRLILDYLNSPAPVFDEAAKRSSVRLITEILKCHISEQTHPRIISKLRHLYRECVNERRATSIDSYIEHRKSVGSLTAELSYLLILPDLRDGPGPLLRFMKQVGAIGCLIDSLIDLSTDHRLGLLGFTPLSKDYAKLVFQILRDGLRVSLRHPGLVRLFPQAIADNVRDRSRATRGLPTRSFTRDRKDEAASVA